MISDALHIAQAEEIARLRAENERLRGALKWYEERTRRLGEGTRPDTYLEAVVVELSADGGFRARAATAPEAPPAETDVSPTAADDF